MIELISWNDYGESHYLRNLPSPVQTATDYIVYASGMQNYVLNMSHAPWRILAKYYIAWWKSGVKPAVTMDQAVFWYRKHSKAVQCDQPGVIVHGADQADDAVFLWVLVRESAIVVVDVGDEKNWEFSVQGGEATMGRVPFPKDLGNGVVPEVKIVRNGVTVAEGMGRVNITASCEWYNMNPVVNLVGQGVNREP
ncbi:Glucan endo-1,3-alpha-glucosidase agn1 [Sphaceloma murrayae]|uniref:Glucan endo-1,3-alpha-glucosidase agn1 n=1 Tax=Sphaceloma murrayae TaxID=2082308 RepID=A0A2K1QYL2_9PEZI|nr:Glucan endo-1,3-alpha-glucosidase agn1 [Sphaceloma murrayae]